MRFDWPDGARGRVHGERTLERSLGATLRASLAYRIEVGRAGDETQIHTGQLEIARITERNEAEAVNAAGVIDVFLPSSVALSDRVERLADFDASRHEIEAAFEPALAASVREGRTWHRLEALWTDRSALTRATASKWDWLVGGFVGRDMLLGEVASLNGSSTTALTAEALETSGDLTAVGRLPCFEGDAVDGCVYIESRTQVAPETTARMGESLNVAGLTMQMRSAIVTEPDTLLPHYAQLVLIRSFTVGEGDAARPVTETETKTFRFAWERATIRR